MKHHLSRDAMRTRREYIRNWRQRFLLAYGDEQPAPRVVEEAAIAYVHTQGAAGSRATVLPEGSAQPLRTARSALLAKQRATLPNRWSRL